MYGRMEATSRCTVQRRYNHTVASSGSEEHEGKGRVRSDNVGVEGHGRVRVAMDTLVRIHPEVWGRRSSRKVPVAAQHCSRIYKGDLVAGLRGAQLSSIAQCKFRGTWARGGSDRLRDRQICDG